MKEKKTFKNSSCGILHQRRLMSHGSTPQPNRTSKTNLKKAPLVLVRCVQGKDLLTQKIPVWQQACSDPNKLPERAMLLAQQMGSAAIAGTSPLHTSKSNLVISDPIPGATPLPVPPELAVFMGSGLGHPSVSGGTTCLMILQPGHIFIDAFSLLYSRG